MIAAQHMLRGVGLAKQRAALRVAMTTTASGLANMPAQSDFAGERPSTPQLHSVRDAMGPRPPSLPREGRERRGDAMSTPRCL